jgi:2-pyrone-4,6-dicarboxylate lactonase
MARPSKPKLELPDGACDTHFHVFGPQASFPYAADRSYTPAGDAPKEALFALHAHLGIERGVVVQSAAHGYDNSAAADLIAARPRAYRGVALVRTGIDNAALEKLNRQGFLGARFHYVKHLASGPSIEQVMEFAKRLPRLGWHLQLHFDAALLEDMMPALARSPVPIVVDHMGRIDASKGLQDSAFQNLLKLLQNKQVWVKVSGAERASRQSAPWRDAIPFAQALVAEFGERALWGSDWPHPNLKEIPDDGTLVDILAEIAPSPQVRQALLVDNPQRFYRFS